MKKIWILIIPVLITIIIFLVSIRLWGKEAQILLSPVGKERRALPLEKYTIENLRKRIPTISKIEYGKKLSENPKYTTWVFTYQSDGRKVSGVANLPIGVATTSAFLTRPVVVMIHGSADKGEYYPGFGTERVAGELAKNGYITFAPDFLGYGDSDMPPKDSAFEERFLTYTTTMDLIASIESTRQNSKLENRKSKQISNLEFSTSNLFLWGHSNGGQIALSILVITGKPYPTVLWNPVTKPFPYNILYFTDGYEDEGLWLRGALAKFEADYDVKKYSFDKYITNITAPILLQQGESDEWVPVKWNRDFVKLAKDKVLKLSYKEYPGANHNLMPLWSQAVTDLLKFYSTVEDTRP